MSVSLYLDSCDFLHIGLLDHKYEWLELLRFEDRKSSAVVHGKLDEIFKIHKIEPIEIKRVFLASGPGSYTGMRLAEGIGQVFSWQGAVINSFYHFEIPSLVGNVSGHWGSLAYKGEVFVYSWDKNIANHQLVLEEEFNSKNWNNLYSFGTDLIGHTTQSTYTLLHDRPSEFFQKIADRSKHLPLFYYRALEKEFKVTQSE